jgi:hypothetical protein
MEEKLSELINRFGGRCISKNGRIYCVILSDYSAGFRVHFKVIFPEKELTFIYFDGKYDVWRVDEKLDKQIKI